MPYPLVLFAYRISRLQMSLIIHLYWLILLMLKPEEDLNKDIFEPKFQPAFMPLDYNYY